MWKIKQKHGRNENEQIILYDSSCCVCHNRQRTSQRRNRFAHHGNHDAQSAGSDGKGIAPLVKAERGMLSYNMPLLLKQLPADNAYEALTRIPGISDATGKISFSGNEVTLIVNGQATTLTQEQLAERLKAMPAAQLAKAEVMLSAPARYHVRGMGYQYRNERLCRHLSVVRTNHWRHGAKQIRQRVWQCVSFHAKRQVRAGCAIQIG